MGTQNYYVRQWLFWYEDFSYSYLPWYDTNLRAVRAMQGNFMADVEALKYLMYKNRNAPYEFRLRYEKYYKI